MRFFSGRRPKIAVVDSAPVASSGMTNLNEIFDHDSTPLTSSTSDGNFPAPIHPVDEAENGVTANKRASLVPSLSAPTLRNGSDSLTADGFSPLPTLSEMGPANGDTSAMSPGYGRATAGKSGRVIEKIMSDNDRLKRDLNLETVRREEEQRRGEAVRLRADQLQDNVNTMKAVEEQRQISLQRKDRKIDELKADLATEKARRFKAEQDAGVMSAERDDAVASAKRDVEKEREKARFAENQYNILASSWKSLESNFEAKIEKLRWDAARIDHQTRLARAKMERLEHVVAEQHRISAQLINEKPKLVKTAEEYAEANESFLRDLKDRIKQNDTVMAKVLKESEAVFQEIHFVRNLSVQNVDRNR